MSYQVNTSHELVHYYRIRTRYPDLASILLFSLHGLDHTKWEASLRPFYPSKLLLQGCHAGTTRIVLSYVDFLSSEQ